MSTETLKISLAQKVLSLSDRNLLNKLKVLIEKENIIGYNGKGNPVYENEYIKEMDLINDEIDNKTAKLFTADEVKQSIIKNNDLAS